MNDVLEIIINWLTTEDEKIKSDNKKLNYKSTNNGILRYHNKGGHHRIPDD